MALSRQKAKGRRESGAFIPLPVSVLHHPNFSRLTAKAVKLLMDLCSQLRFKKGGSVNNGDLSAAFSLMQPRGWRSEETLQNALDELLHFNFLTRTRKGGKNLCALYAVTWWAIDECNGKLDIRETRAPSNQWKNDCEDFMPRRKRKQRKHRKTESLPRKTHRITPIVGVTGNPNRAQKA